MTQPGFDFAEPVRPRKRGHVVRTSVLAYQERDRTGRVAFVVEALQMEGEPITSAELHDAFVQPKGPDMDIYWVRRGLSDALALGLVSHAGERTCAVSGRVCKTWKVSSR